MSHILIVDDGELARLALGGILAERGHTFTFASGTVDAWRMLHDLDQVDLVIVELKLKNELTVPFVQKIRSTGLFRSLPVLVYTSVSDISVVRSVLALRPQNYLLKPYRGDLVHHEIEKAVSAGWNCVPEVGQFASTLGVDASSVLERRCRLAVAINDLGPALAAVHDSGSGLRTLPKLKLAAEECAHVGIARVSQFLSEMVGEAESEHWWSLKECGLAIDHIVRILSDRRGIVGGSETNEAGNEAPPRDFAIWQAAESSGEFPLNREYIQAELDALSACPSIDTIAASFVMSAEGSRSNLSHLNDLVCQDPGLAASVLMAANKLAREGDLNPIEDPEMAVGMLGDVKMVALARATPQVSERALHLPPFTWSHYRLFQLGVARVSEFVRQSMELNSLEGVARTAGLLHDLGQLLVMRLFPHGFKVMLKFSADRGLCLDEAQRHFLGTTGRELAGPFFARLGLPSVYCTVFEHVIAPSRANAQAAELVAVVSLARHLCNQNGLGLSGDHCVSDIKVPLEQTEAWKVLKERVYPGFQFDEFHQQASALCARLKDSLYKGGYTSRSKSDPHHHSSSKHDPWRL